jgi:hypothetical protein
MLLLFHLESPPHQHKLNLRFSMYQNTRTQDFATPLMPNQKGVILEFSLRPYRPQSDKNQRIAARRPF